jgi:phosphotransferase system enzyme I (PtsP)
VLDAAGDRPVIFRTVDIGGDKALPYMNGGEAHAEENPALGWRAIRLALERDGLMKAQARALIEAAAGRVLNVMFPMVSEPWEFEQARALFEAQFDWIKGRGKPLPTAIRYGTMLEVPALAETLDLLLPRLDFLSVGTNDLTQFLFAADRAHPKLAERYDWLSPAILRFMARVTREANIAGVPIGVGIERLSITPAAIGPVKAMIRTLNVAELRAVMPGWLAAPPRSLRGLLSGWASENGVNVG